MRVQYILAGCAHVAQLARRNIALVVSLIITSAHTPTRYGGTSSAGLLLQLCRTISWLPREQLIVG